MPRMDPKDVPEDAIPAKVIQAGLDFVKAVNESGARCVGVVLVAVFEDCERVLPILDNAMRVEGGKDPMRALLEQAADAINDGIARTGDDDGGGASDEVN